MVWALVFFAGQISGSFCIGNGLTGLFGGHFLRKTARGWRTGATPQLRPPSWMVKLWQRYLLLACPQNLETLEWHLCWFLLSCVVFVSHNPSRRIVYWQDYVHFRLALIQQKTCCWSKMWFCPLTGRYASDLPPHKGPGLVRDSRS